MIRKTLSILITLFLGISCNNSTENSVEPFDVVQWRTDFIEKIETPSTASLVESIDVLHAQILLFSEATTLVNLEALQASWKVAALAYSKNEILNIGDVKNTAIHNAFYSWGVNGSIIDAYINGEDMISEENINALSTNVRGLGAIEYLIFNGDNDTLLTLFSSTERRKQYVEALGANLVIKVATLNTSWSSYRADFLNNNQTGINGAINMVVNQMNALLEDVRKFKVGEPAGLENSSIANIDLLQAEKSAFSTELIQENIKAIESIYFNEDEGLSAYVKSITGTDELNNIIENQFSLIANDITSLNNEPLKEAIINNINTVEALYNDLNGLILHIKNDVASTLSITITFTDNDGD